MGIVFLAEQERPVRRKVALKVIKPGMDTEQVVTRFEAERQALALMDHPGIARVLDAGATDSGRPFFVMELVDGVPINEYCDRERLSPRQRLELFVAVCRSIEHAHQKGIIHRDIKPSNVLVTLIDGQAVPKVIDFGVAKAIDQRLTERTLFTQLGALVGTPEYMSPEQAGDSGAGIDTRSDVYALGVLLYELLTGTTPLGRGTAAGGGLLGGPAADPRGGAAQAEHAAERLGRGARVDRGMPRHRAGADDPAGAGRARLDHDEGPRERPGAAVCDGPGAGPGRATVPGRRARGSVAAIAALSRRQARATSTAARPPLRRRSRLDACGGRDLLLVAHAPQPSGRAAGPHERA